MKRLDRREVVEELKERTADSVRGESRAGQDGMLEVERRLERSPPREERTLKLLYGGGVEIHN